VLLVGVAGYLIPVCSLIVLSGKPGLSQEGIKVQDFSLPGKGTKAGRCMSWRMLALVPGRMLCIKGLLRVDMLASASFDGLCNVLTEGLLLGRFCGQSVGEG